MVMLEVHVAFIFGVKWRQHGPLKQWYPIKALHGINPEDLVLKGL